MLYAYIDPGSGTLLLQAIMAAIAGIVLFHKRLYYSIKGYFKKEPADSEGPGGDTGTPSEEPSDIKDGGR